MTTRDDDTTAPRRLLGGGVEVLADGALAFRLFAPRKTSVSLIGDFNGWDAGADPLTCDERGMWRLEKRLPPGRYEYQYVLDGDIIICDPYATLVTRKTGDGPQTGVVVAGGESYAWRHAATWRRPPFNELVMYELHVLDFSPEGNLNGVIAGLDYLADLGVTAIELMPINEFAGEEGGETSWGYDPTYFFALHPAYGTPTEFKQLVDEAHGRGIAVVMDIVLAHTSRLHPFTQMYEWADSPWYGTGLGEVNQFGFPMLDYGRPATERLTEDILAFWLQEYGVDGFRFDYAAGIGAKILMGLPHLVVAARKVDDHAYLIAEYLPEEHAVLRSAAFDGNWHGRQKNALWALFSERDYHGFSAFRFREATSTFDPFDDGYTGVTVPVNYIESHDEERLAAHLATELDFAADAVTAKLKLAATLLMTLPGVPLLYQGQEWGEATPKQINRPNPLHWESREAAPGADIHAHYRRMAALRKAQPALCSLEMTFETIDRGRRTIVFRRFAPSGDAVRVAVNFSPVRQEVDIYGLSAGAWDDCLGAAAPVGEASDRVALEPYSAALWVTRSPE